MLTRLKAEGISIELVEWEPKSEHKQHYLLLEFYENGTLYDFIYYHVSIRCYS